MSDYYHQPINSLLREAPRNLARSAYAVEVNPWAIKGEIEAAMLFRGTIVSAYGFIETTLGEVCLRASRLPEYAEIRSNFPFSTKKRISFLREVFKFGPLAPYRSTAVRFLDKFESKERLRNLVAHAKMQVHAEDGVDFTDYPETYDGGAMRAHTPMSLRDLEIEAWRSALRSRLAQKLLDELNSLRILPCST